jgi:hypothetical protein
MQICGQLCHVLATSPSQLTATRQPTRYSREIHADGFRRSLAVDKTIGVTLEALVWYFSATARYSYPNRATRRPQPSSLPDQRFRPSWRGYEAQDFSLLKTPGRFSRLLGIGNLVRVRAGYVSRLPCATWRPMRILAAVRVTMAGRAADARCATRANLQMRWERRACPRS